MKYKICYLIFTIYLVSSCKDNKTAIENFNKGIKYYDDSSFSFALSEFTLASEKDIKNSNIFFYKGLCEMRLDKNKEALLSFQNAINIDSTKSSVFVERAKLKIKLGDYNSAIKDCDKANYIERKNPEIYLTQGLAYEYMNDNENAILSYEKAIRYGNKDGATYYKLGILKLSNNQDEACEFLSKAGELGFMEAYEMIKRNCNPNYKYVLNSSSENGNTVQKKSSVKVVNGRIIKVEEDDNDTYKNKVSNINEANKIIANYGKDIPKIKIGDVFSDLTNDYKLKGISSKTNEHFYEYNKPIKSSVYGHKVDYIVLTIKNNVIIGYVFILVPNVGELGVPKEMADRFKIETGYELGKRGDLYGATIDNMFVTISRGNEPNNNKDRIMIKVLNTN